VYQVPFELARLSRGFVGLVKPSPEVSPDRVTAWGARCTRR
jgi:hypothetical protein